MSQVIILNGPAGCGKDTVGKVFADREGFEGTCFKEPIFRIAATTLGMDYHEFYEMYQDREWKDSPNEKLNGRTIRELMIHISETYVKPFMGADYFGQQAANYIRLRPWQNKFLFTDGGFAPEMEALVAAGHEVLLVHMYREGCTFEGDSRSYVLTNSVPRIYTLTNNGTVDEAVDALGRILDNYEDSRERPDETEDEAPQRGIRARGHREIRASSPTGRRNTPRTESVAEILARARNATPRHASWITTSEPVRRREEPDEERSGSDVRAVSDGDSSIATATWINGSFGTFGDTTNAAIVHDELASVSEDMPRPAV